MRLGGINHRANTSLNTLIWEFCHFERMNLLLEQIYFGCGALTLSLSCWNSRALATGMHFFRALIHITVGWRYPSYTACSAS